MHFARLTCLGSPATAESPSLLACSPPVLGDRRKTGSSSEAWLREMLDVGLDDNCSLSHWLHKRLLFTDVAYLLLS